MMLNVPDDYLYLAVGPNCWGKGETEEEAVRTMKKVLGRPGLKRVRQMLFLVDPTTIVDGMGDLVYKDLGRTPILLKKVE